MSKYITQEPWLFVEITEPTKEEVAKFYKGGLVPDSKSKNYIKIFKTAKIKFSYDESLYKTGTKWMMADNPPQVINYHGEEITMIQNRHLYAQVDE